MYKNLDYEEKQKIFKKVLEDASKEELIKVIFEDYDAEDYFENELNVFAEDYINEKENNSSCDYDEGDDYSRDELIDTTDFSYYDYIESQIGKF